MRQTSSPHHLHRMRGWIWLMVIGAGLCDPASSFAQRRVRMRNFPGGAVEVIQAVGETLAKPAGPPAAGTPPETIVTIPVEGSADAAVVEQVRQKFKKELDSLNRQRAADGLEPLTAPSADVPKAVIDMAHYGLQHTGTGPVRFFAVHLLLENPTKTALTVPRADIAAKIDGEDKPIIDLPDNPQFSFQFGTQFQNLQGHKQPKEVAVPAGGVAGTWIVYSNLPMTSEVPPLALQVKIGGQTVPLDITASQRALLNMDVEKLGPRQCLRLLTIRGMLNSINVQSFINTLEDMTERKVVRCVLQWTNDTTAPEQNLSHWLVQSVIQLGSGRPVNEQLPSFPAQLREFHIVWPNVNGFPNMDQFGRQQSGQRLHRSAADAVSAALKSAYLALPADELLIEIEHGHSLARAAAIRHGSSKLSSSHVPFLLGRMTDDDPEVRVAAVRALNQFSEPAALEALVSLAKETSHPLNGTAIESLAGSRYAVAQARLLELIQQSSGDAKKQIMQVLAKYPRPQWSELIYAYVTDPKENYPIEGVRALLQVGHPQIVDVLEACLKHEDKARRDLVYPILTQRNDARSEKLATAYAMAQLQQQPPDGTTVQFLHRTKLSPAIPFLVKHLESAPDKNSLLNLLAQIGDESVAEPIANRYDKLQPHEKGQALNALRILRYPKFRALAGEALLTNDSNLISQATQGLIQDGSNEACQLLITALDKNNNNFAISQVSNALSNFGTPEARAALLKARSSDNQQRRNYAINALQNLYQRSPGYQYIYQAQEHLRQKQWKEALEMYEMSLQVDPELPEALAGRGSARHRLGKHEESVKDFEKAYEIDPYNHLAIPGLAIARVQAGKLEEGFKILGNGKERYQHDPAFIYNSACVYAQAAQWVSQQKDLPDREAKQDEYRKKALAELQNAVTRGFQDYAVAKDDPDLKILKDDPEFKKWLGNRGAEKKGQDAEAKVEAVEE